MNHDLRQALGWGAVLWMATACGWSGELPSFDFTAPTAARDWGAPHHITALAPTPEGLRVSLGGPDPYFFGPARDYPEDRPLWLRLKLKSDQGGTCQVFYFRDAPTEEQSVRFSVPAGAWFEASAPLPPLGRRYRLRIDPPGDAGTCTLQRLWFEERPRLVAPPWPRPQPPEVGADALSVRSGDLELLHGRDSLGTFRVSIGDRPMAVGNPAARIGYAWGGELRWVSPATAARDGTTVRRTGEGLAVRAEFSDPDGARWEVRQEFKPGAPGTIAVDARVSVDQDREVVYLPMFTLLPGVGSFGTNKTQALLPGVEYLENEPSSSEADVIGPGARRQVPDTLKLTLPLMALAADGRYLGLVWEPRPEFCALFDSPDRLFDSGGHVLGLLFPGSDGTNREEGNLLPYAPARLRSRQPLELRATLIGGAGQTVVPAVQQYVRLRGLPELPTPAPAARDVFRLAAHGWLDSAIRVGNRFRHAAPNFEPQPAADAAMWMRWLAGRVDDSLLATRLRDTAAAAIGEVPPPHYNTALVGHVRWPLPALVFGHVAENAAQAAARARGLLGRFQPDGSVLYQPAPDRPDFGRTHWAREANGLTASVVVDLLQAAAFAGERDLIDDALRRLRALDKFRDTVPRGAQTWEIPLHTPDILAAAHLVQAYTLGYELTGEPNFLAAARDWAWTGVPFVYLVPPTDAPIGLYATIPVLGATHWRAPLWIGLPVQWCGLVYAEALQALAAHDPDGPWKHLADGIVLSGVQQTYPRNDAKNQGLLPDSFNLRAQSRNPANINPATLLAPAVTTFGEAKAYQFRAFRRHGWLVHAPGELHRVVERPDGIRFQLRSWLTQPGYLLINGLDATPQVNLNGRPLELTEPHQHDPQHRRIVLQVRDGDLVELLVPR